MSDISQLIVQGIYAMLEGGRCFLGEKNLGALCARETQNGGGNAGKMVVKVQ